MPLDEPNTAAAGGRSPRPPTSPLHSRSELDSFRASLRRLRRVTAQSEPTSASGRRSSRSSTLVRYVIHTRDVRLYDTDEPSPVGCSRPRHPFWRCVERLAISATSCSRP